MNRSLPKGRRGFALVITLAMLALLVLAVYALSALVRVNAQVASAGVAQMQARQNALLGLSIACGELQRTAGIDSIVTGRSSVRAKTAANSVLLGLWNGTNPTVDPINWMVSGNFPPDSPRSINSLGVPSEATDVVTLLGENTVVKSSSGRNYARAKKLAVLSESGVRSGGYAFWIGDEGVKAPVATLSSQAPLSGSGSPLLASPRGEVPTFSASTANLQRIVAAEQLSFLAPGASLKSRFHDYAHRAQWVSGANVVAGLFNLNTTSEESWKAVFAAYDAARPAGSVALGSRYADVAESLTGLFTNRATSGGKVRQGPYISVDAFWDSGLVADALTAAGVLDIEQDDIRTTLGPIFTVRSDTFRIRAYGEALNPVDGATIEARAYCEAIVQRTPEIIDSITGPMGRRFVVTYFRWLGPDDI